MFPTVASQESVAICNEYRSYVDLGRVYILERGLLRRVPD